MQCYEIINIIIIIIIIIPFPSYPRPSISNAILVHELPNLLCASSS